MAEFHIWKLEILESIPLRRVEREQSNQPSVTPQASDGQWFPPSPETQLQQVRPTPPRGSETSWPWLNKPCTN